MAKKEFNYVPIILLVVGLIGGYCGWKYGPGLKVAKLDLASLAAKCAAKMNMSSDEKIEKEVLIPGFKAYGLSMSQDVGWQFDRSDPRKKKCIITYYYENEHVWDTKIEKKYTIVGASQLGH